MFWYQWYIGIELKFSKLKENGSFNSVAWCLQLIWQEMLQWSALPTLYLFTVQNLSELRGVSANVRQCPPVSAGICRDPTCIIEGQGLAVLKPVSLFEWMSLPRMPMVVQCALLPSPGTGGVACAVHRLASASHRICHSGPLNPTIVTLHPADISQNSTPRSSFQFPDFVWSAGCSLADEGLVSAPLCCAPAPLRTAAASFVYKPPSWSRPQLSYWPLLRNLSVNICLYTFPPHQTQLQPPVNGKMAGTGYCSSGTHSRVCSELRCRKAATHCVPRAPRTHSIFHTGSTLLRIMHYMTDFPVTAPAGGRLFLAEMSASDLVQ